MANIHSVWGRVELERVEFQRISGIHSQVQEFAPLSDVDHLLRDSTDLSMEGVMMQALTVPVICAKKKNDYQIIGGYRTYQLLAHHFWGDTKTKIPILVLNGGTREQLRTIAQYSLAGLPLVNCLGKCAPRQIGRVVLETNPDIRQSKRGRPSRNEEFDTDSGIFRIFFPKVTSPSGLAKLMGVKPEVVLEVMAKKAPKKN